MISLARMPLAALLASAALAAPAHAHAATPPSVRFDGAAAGDLAGTSVAAAGDVNGDGVGDLVIGASGAVPDPALGYDPAGAAYVAFGPFTPGTAIDLSSLGGRGFAIRGALHSQAGTVVAAAGDVNGDGLRDVIVGAPGASPSQEGPMQMAGRAYVVFGTRTPHDVDLSALGADGIVLTGESHYFPDAFGWSVAALGDVDHDGLDDVAIAAPGNPGFEEDYTAGRAYVVFGRRTPGTIAMAALGRAGFRIGFGTPGELTGVSAAGDWNRDGHPDVAVIDGEAMRGAGAVWIVYGRRRRGMVNVGRLGRDGVVIRGNTTFHYQLQGGGLAGGADVDGDHRSDLVLGAPRAHTMGIRSAGAVFAVRGTTSRRRIDLRTPGTRAWEAVRGLRESWTGGSLALADVNGDRLADTVVSARGSLAVVYGSRSHATRRLDALPADRGFLVDGRIEPLPSQDGRAGDGGFTVVGAAPDLNGDGHADLLAGARWAGHNDRALSGSAYLLFAP